METAASRGRVNQDKRDAQEFVQFYEETVEIVYGYFMRRTAGDRHLSEDLTQETYMTAASTFGPGIKSRSAWIVAIARRRLIDHIRRSRVRPRTTSEPSEADWPADWGDEDHAVFAALARLEPDQRMVLLLHYVDGLPVGEVATLMNRSRPATYSLLARSRQSLREALKEAADE